ncbi:MAG TPA: J domain-containing protein [Firmicutes bacterium]|nr:J domain-containing protein [Bacillota bacterium]
MATSKGKQYGPGADYERKLHRVMERLGVKEFNWNYDRCGAWVQFRYKGELYQFDHSVEKARARGINLHYGSDAFAQIVLSLEDLARMVERGIYDLQTWVAGMKMLPPVSEVPSFLRLLGFTEIPSDVEEVRARFRTLAKQFHPDVGGSAEDFDMLKRAAEQAVQYMQSRSRGGEA